MSVSFKVSNTKASYNIAALPVALVHFSIFIAVVLFAVLFVVLLLKLLRTNNVV